MPIIQNHSDKYRPQLVIATLIYILVPITVLAFIYSIFSNPSQSNQPNDEQELKYVCFEKDVEQYLVDRVETWALDHTEYRATVGTEATNCNVSIERNSTDPNDLNKLFDNTYIIVRREGSRLSNISEDELLDALITQSLSDYNLLWNAEVDSFLRSNFNIGVGQVVYTDAQIADRIMSDQLYLAILKQGTALDSLRVIRIDNQSPFSKDYNSFRYPLVDRYWIGGTDEDDIEIIYGILLEETGNQE